MTFGYYKFENGTDHRGNNGTWYYLDANSCGGQLTRDMLRKLAQKLAQAPGCKLKFAPVYPPRPLWRGEHMSRDKYNALVFIPDYYLCETDFFYIVWSDVDYVAAPCDYRQTEIEF